MSMTLAYGPSAAYVHGAFEPITFVLTSTEQASTSPQYYKFKYIADIYVEDTSSPYAYALQARIKIEPNGKRRNIMLTEKGIEIFKKLVELNELINKP